TVNLFGTGIGQEKLLGATNTDDEGQYNIKYSPSEFAVNINSNARVVVRVLDSKSNIVAASPPFVASPEEDVALSVNTGPELYTVSGFVRNKSGKGMPDHLVRLFGKNIVIGNERLIKQAVTDSEGRYFIEYDPAEFKPNVEDTNRLIIRIFNKSEQLLEPASPLFRASKEESVDITLSGPLPPDPTNPKDLEICRNQLSQTQQALATCEQNQASLRRTLEEREQFIKEQQAVISALQKRINALEEIINEDGQRVPVEPSRFGMALGDAVDAIQQGLTNLQNNFVDYGLQELDIQTQVNLQVSRDGQLQIRFPGLNEQVSPQNLSQLQFRLRPIPKSQKNQEGNGQPGSL
ncbi:MAG TPA: hypothetical protein VLR90_05795, partial [Blastocatellia bacterium]|nr:hypothetical protein [Blastocatellia bacterium]